MRNEFPPGNPNAFAEELVGFVLVIILFALFIGAVVALDRLAAWIGRHWK